MKAKFTNYYRKSGGRTVFVYTVTGTEKELLDYKEAQGDNYREDEKGAPLFFAPRPLSVNRNESVTIMITNNGNAVADDAEREFIKADKLEDYMLREQARLMAAAAMGGQVPAVDALANITASRPIEEASTEPAVEVKGKNVPS